MKQKIKLIVVLLLIIFFVPFLLDVLIFNKTIPSPVSNDAWAGLLGAYIGAMIGAITTYVTVRLEMKNNDRIRREDIQREFRPYLYFRAEKIDDRKKSIDVVLYNFGKYAACDIKGYIISPGKKKLAWKQHFSIDGNSEFSMFIALLPDNDNYYLFEFKDILGRKYEQIVRYDVEDVGIHILDLYSEEPRLIE